MTELRPAGSPVEGERALRLLREGRLTVEGRLVDASNATLYCTVELDGMSANCVYKPIAGERPLWDFPDGTLAGREVAAYAVSHALGWEVVPPTVHRDGPFGPGMCQLWIHADTGVDLLELARDEGHAGLRRMAIFDAVVNNSDRKIGHLLPTPGGHLYGCDHGVCFSVDYKLRTVLWQWQGESLPEDTIADLRRLRRALESGPLAEELRTHVTEREVWAARRRVELLVEHGIHPYPSEDWPSVPWPPV
ncbi:MAG: SCO1664 family protein [Streptosporangiales bacterium]|nr:SCO1664 family protein [Streptosporangiales bacterium]